MTSPRNDHRATDTVELRRAIMEAGHRYMIAGGPHRDSSRVGYRRIVMPRMADRHRSVTRGLSAAGSGSSIVMRDGRPGCGRRIVLRSIVRSRSAIVHGESAGQIRAFGREGDDVGGIVL